MTAATLGLMVWLTALSAAGLGQKPPDALGGTAWTAVELAGMTVPAAGRSGDSAAHLGFGADGRLSGSDGCNRVAGPYTVKDDALTFGQIVGTMMACAGTDEIVRGFHGALKGTSRWRIVADRLELYGTTGKPLAVFERRAMPPPAASASPLQGTTWQLVTFKGGDDRTLTPDDQTKYTLSFLAGGRLAARLDCNRGQGSWKSPAPSQLELGPLALTRAKCPDGSMHDQMVTQWTSVRSYVIKDGHLFLSLMADGGIYEFEPQPPTKP